MINCRVCGENEKIEVKFRKHSHNILSCKNCGLTFLDYNPKLSDIKKFYSKNYFLGEGDDFGYYNYFDEKPNILKTSQKRVTEIERLTQKGKILDIGCATGFFLEAAKNRGWQVFGVEVSKFAGNFAKGKFGRNIKIGQLQENSFPKNFFDTITLWDTIEHLPNPKKTLEIIFNILVKKGVLALSTGDIESILAKISGKSWHLYHLPEHLSFFSPKTVTKLLEDCGFKIISITHPGSYYTFEYLIRRLTGSYPNPIFKFAEKKATNTILAKFSLYVNLFDIMTVYAKKG